MSTVTGVGLVQAKIKEGCNLQTIHARAWNEPTCSQCVDLYASMKQHTQFLCHDTLINAYLGITSQCLYLISE